MQKPRVGNNSGRKEWTSEEFLMLLRGKVRGGQTVVLYI